MGTFYVKTTFYFREGRLFWAVWSTAFGNRNQLHSNLLLKMAEGSSAKAKKARAPPVVVSPAERLAQLKKAAEEKRQKDEEKAGVEQKKYDEQLDAWKQKIDKM